MKNSIRNTSAREVANGIVVQSDDGAVCFTLHSTRLGLWVERVRRHADHQARLVQSVVFSDTIGFSRWCDADSVRFEYPIVFLNIKREGVALLEAHERTLQSARDHSER